MGVFSSFEVPWKWKHSETAWYTTMQNIREPPFRGGSRQKNIGKQSFPAFSVLWVTSCTHSARGSLWGPWGTQGSRAVTILWKWHAGRSRQGCSCLVSVPKAAGGWSAHAALRAICFLFSLPLVTFCIMQSQTFVQRSFSLPGSVSGMGSSLLHLVWKRAILTPSFQKCTYFWL